VTGSLLAPTLLRFGLMAGGVDRTVEFHPLGPQMLAAIVARFFSFTAFETNRFIGLTTAERLLFLWRQPWVAPSALLVTLIGIVQPVGMALAWFRRVPGSAEWRRVKWLTTATVVWIYISFFFSVRGPLAHAFYVVFPVAAMYTCYCWRMFAGAPGPGGTRFRAWERMAAGALAAGVLMHAGVAIDRAPRKSLYVDRGLVQTAISARNDRYLGDRRDSLQQTQDRRPRAFDSVRDVDAYLRADPVADLDVVDTSWSPVGGGRISRFIVSLHNRSDSVAYLDIRYATVYSSAAGQGVAEREGVIKEILQPGESRSWNDVADGLTPEGAAIATFRIVSAEKCIPVKQSAGAAKT